MRPFYSRKAFFHPLSALKSLVILHVGFSLFCALFDTWFPHWNLPSPQALFSLSLWGLEQGFLWQFFTYFFISPPSGGLTFPFILYLLFNMYFLWVVGASVLEKRGIKHFLLLYLGGGIISGLTTAAVLLKTGSFAPIAGIHPALYALLTAWMMLLPEVQILLFFTIPIKIKWLILGILGINLFVDLSQGNLVHFVLYLTAIGFGYFYALCVWQIHGPFPRIYPFERLFIGLGRKLEQLFSSTPAHSSGKGGKIYDFRTGKALVSDEEFLDACLSKVATQGTGSLTFLERWKMRRISKRKKRSF